MIGNVLAVETGVVVVATPRGEVRASWSGRLLARVARDRGRSPRVGDRVALYRWPDARWTVERVLPHESEDTVVPLRLAR